MRALALSITFLLAATALAVEPLPVAPAPRPVPDRVIKFTEIRDEYTASMRKMLEAQRNAKTKQDIDAALAFLPKIDKLTSRILPLVTEDPKDELAFDMLTFIATRARPGDTGPAEVYRLLAEHHAVSERVGTLLAHQSMMLPAARPFVERVIAVHPDRTTRAKAALALAQAAFQTAERADSPRAMVAAEQEAEIAYRRVVEDFADVKLGGRDNRTAGEKAKEALSELAELGIGKPFPNIAFESLGGKTERVADYKGKVVVIDVWATWCGPCRAMIPHERGLVTRLKDKPFALVSVSGDNEKSTLEKFVKDTEMPWIHWWAGANKGELLRKLHIRHFPTIYVLDAKGVIRFKSVRGEKMDKAIDSLLDELAKPAGGE